MGANAALGLLLALLSAFTSAFAHALLKSGEDKLAILTCMRFVEFGAALPFVLWVGLPPAALWPWLLAAMAVHALYQLILSWSYAVSDFTAAYPIARGFAPIFTALLGMAFLGDVLDGFALLCIALVSVGILCLTRRGSISPTGFLAAAITGPFTTCYTLVDAHGVRVAPQALVFIAWFFLIGALPMPTLLFARHGKRAFALLSRDRRPGLLAGAMSTVSFAPALFALGLAPVGAVSAIRESSILIGLLLGSVMLKEKLGLRRLSGALLVTFGMLGVILRAALA